MPDKFSHINTSLRFTDHTHLLQYRFKANGVVLSQDVNAPQASKHPLCNPELIRKGRVLQQNGTRRNFPTKSFSFKSKCKKSQNNNFLPQSTCLFQNYFSFFCLLGTKPANKLRLMGSHQKKSLAHLHKCLYSLFISCSN